MRDGTSVRSRYWNLVMNRLVLDSRQQLLWERPAAGCDGLGQSFSKGGESILSNREC